MTSVPNHDVVPLGDYYSNNPLVHRDRRLALAQSEWVRSFSCDEMRPLIICRGPIRKEAMDVFREMGMTGYGILLSEKDSIVYPHSLSPELRIIAPEHVHRIPDYSGATKDERRERIRQIIRIAKTHGYDYVFAGYGFMAEDEELVSSLEAAGIGFIGPCSYTVQSAGFKDEAKRTAIETNVSVTPGVSDLTTRALLAKHPDRASLMSLAKQRGLELDPGLVQADVPASWLAQKLLDASYDQRQDLLDIDAIAAQLQIELTKLFEQFPNNRIRIKAIGGGGGKGQRILDAPSAFGSGPIAERIEKAAAKGPEKYREVIAEVKAGGVGDNKNVLLELNIEQTRHHEIQLLGNGEWCIALGGRDCSLQMHEQKLLEISITQEALSAEIQKLKGEDKTRANALKQELETLRTMEAEAERFGQAVKLDSVSTFECIVEAERHFFMEVNTRIQVEHRVTELCYSLRFRNPFNQEDYFDVDSLVAAMALLAKHKKRLPKPERRPRKGAALEARLNATDDALQPHAGGIIQAWTDPIEGEIRDDQGICIKNPDTNLFMRYKFAGAYDSNIALLVTHGEDREAAFDRLNEILRLTRMRGYELATNLEFHYGLVNWFRTRHVYAKPTTRFVVPYLTQVGLLKLEALELDVDFAMQEIAQHHETRLTRNLSEPEAGRVVARVRELAAKKHTLLLRPVERLLACPHVLSGWLSAQHKCFRLEAGRVVWLKNPVRVLAETYQVLNMESQGKAAPAQVIWDHDEAILSAALGFYEELEQRIGTELRGNYPELDALIRRPEPPAGYEGPPWERIRAAHEGFQLGLELLGLLPLVGDRAEFFGLRVEPDLTVHIPDRLLDPALQDRMKKVLVPPPATKADEIVAASGGMFYAQEAPNLPPLIREGEHFEAGQPLYLIEVMKMFNKVPAPFSGTVTKRLIDVDGTIVTKGQPLYKVTPDERFVERDPAEVEAKRREHTKGYLSSLLS